ncbi:MAG: hypothetical protein H6704_29845 [Myxococcales bacterium]|nr:hypothetical protein [Myxococcales bacterium]
MRALALMWVVLLVVGCDDGAGGYPIDVEGPRGRALLPGPWPVRVLTDGPAPTLYFAVDDGGFTTLPLGASGGGLFEGTLPAQPEGARLRYYVQVEGRAEPPGGAAAPFAAVVQAVAAAAPDAGPSGPCGLAFRHPVDGQALDRRDDGAPQAGLQLTVVVRSNLPDGTAARLEVEGVGYAGAAGGGVVAFEGVTMPPGEVALTADAVAPGGEPCAATITVTVR